MRRLFLILATTALALLALGAVVGKTVPARPLPETSLPTRQPSTLSNPAAQ